MPERGDPEASKPDSRGSYSSGLVRKADELRSLAIKEELDYRCVTLAAEARLGTRSPCPSAGLSMLLAVACASGPAADTLCLGSQWGLQ